MRIDLSVANQAVEAAPDNQATTTRSLAAASAGEAASLPQDTASLSGDQVSVDGLTAQALASGESRSAKVGALQQAVGSGTYKVDASAVADAMLGESA